MAQRKLDMGKAWTQATGMIGANRDTIGAIAGLFFFLPTLAVSLLVPELGTASGPGGAGSADQEAALQAALDQMNAIYADNWPAFLAIGIASLIGSMSLFALFTDRGRPTVSEALRTGVASTPSYLAAQLLAVIGAMLAIGLPIGVISAMGGAAVATLAVFVALVLIVYVLVKLALIAPVIAIDGLRNPFAAIARSWQLTKGNSLRIFIFIALLLVVIVIISALVSGVVGLVMAAIGGEIATIGNAIFGALLNAVLTVLFLAVTVAIHRQLSGGSPEAAAATFE